MFADNQHAEDRYQAGTRHGQSRPGGGVAKYRLHPDGVEHGGSVITDIKDCGYKRADYKAGDFQQGVVDNGVGLTTLPNDKANKANYGNIEH